MRTRVIVLVRLSSTASRLDTKKTMRPRTRTYSQGPGRAAKTSRAAAEGFFVPSKPLHTGNCERQCQFSVHHNRIHGFGSQLQLGLSTWIP
jgi:hypothetical protein